MACHSRVASCSSETAFGLPEGSFSSFSSFFSFFSFFSFSSPPPLVPTPKTLRAFSFRPFDNLISALVLLGVLPGAGGTQRLPNIIGAEKGLDLMLTGKSIDWKEAQACQLVDLVVEPSALLSAAKKVAKELINGTRTAFQRPFSLRAFLLEGNPWGISLLISQARKRILEKTRGHYPAPLAIIEVVEEGLRRGKEAGYKKERESFAYLGTTPESKALMSVFFGKNFLKKNPFGSFKISIDSIVILGANHIGSGIAQVFFFFFFFFFFFD